MENLNDWSMTALEYRPVESHVLVRVRLSARGRESGMEIAGERFHVFSFRGGRIIRFEVFREERDALEAVGLAE